MTQRSNAESSVDLEVLREIEHLFRQILAVGDGSIDAATSFFALGGSSLQAVALAACLQTKFDVEVTALSILDHPTPAVLTRHVTELRAQAGGPEVDQEQEEGLL